MKLPENLIHELINALPKDISLDLVLLIKDKPNISEFKVAEKMDVTVNEVRHHLYKLGEHTLVSSIRKKDKKKGWHVSFWTFNNIKARNLLLELSQSKIKRLRQEIKKEQQGQYYFCPNKCMRLDYLDALETNFTCTECGKVMVQGNVKRRISEMDKEIIRLKQIVGEAELIKEPVKRKKPEPVKKKAVKKTAKKTVKKATTKKATVKKTVKKTAKKTVKKATTKKTTVKKTVKKTAPKKKAIKKTAPKKTVKKATTKKEVVNEAVKKTAPQKKGLIKRLLRK